MSQNLKTAHPQEGQLYRGMGGSIARFGMGDNDRASNSMRGIFEGKLLNRSLVLVGGGVHRHGSASKSLDKGDGEAKAMGVVGLGMAQAASSGKRERKRVGGNGIFGSISNKKRKKTLQYTLEKQSKQDEDSELKIHDGDAGQKLDATTQSENLDQHKQLQGVSTPADIQGQVGTVIEKMHGMWVDYMHQLLSPIKKGNVSTSKDSSSLSLADRKQLSFLLATAEHVGMPATFLECPLRRHLLNSRCIVVNETKETWKVAIVSKRKDNTKDAKLKEKNEIVDKSNHEKYASTKSSTPPTPSWKIVMVPKRGTVLEVGLQWDGDNAMTSHQLKSYITLRLET